MPTESSPRVLTCAYNNRRRNRIHPLTHPNIINNVNMNLQTLKANKNKPIISSKIKKHSINKLYESDETFENVVEWSTRIPKGSSHEKTRKILSAEESSSSLRDEACNDTQPSIFRQIINYDDRDEMMVLKRASPIYDSDDDEDSKPIPFKRQRTLEGATALRWGDRLEETSDGFSSMHLLRE